MRLKFVFGQVMKKISLFNIIKHYASSEMFEMGLHLISMLVASPFQEEAEEEEEEEIEEIIPYVPPVSKTWESYGSEVEIEEQMVIEHRLPVWCWILNLPLAVSK